MRDESRYLSPVYDPTREERVAVVKNRQRMAAAVGYRIPSDRVGNCPICKRRRPLLNVRAQPDTEAVGMEPFDVGDCQECGSTITALPEESG